MKKFFKWSLLVFVAILFIGTFVFLYQRSKKEEISYETYTAAINNLEQTSVVTGSVEPRNEVHILKSQESSASCIKKQVTK